MAEFQIPKQTKVNIRTLAKGFGLPIVKRAIIDLGSESVYSDSTDGTSVFGTPLYGTLFIEKPTFTKYEYNELDKIFQTTTTVLSSEDKQGEKDGLLLQGVLIDINQVKNVVTTEIAGGNGTVKEYVNAGDYNITIRGFIANENPGEFPERRVKLLLSYFNAPVELNVINTYLNNLFFINNIVVTSFNLFQQEGTRNIQFFEANCLSEFTNNVIIKNA